jgi:hypothetical protein
MQPSHRSAVQPPQSWLSMWTVSSTSDWLRRAPA